MTSPGTPPAEAGAIDLLLWWIGRRQRVVVRGQSMEPALRAGDEVLVDLRAYRRGPPGLGDIVLLRHPVQGDLTVIKRVAERRPLGLWLLGDNPAASSDSRSFGAVPEGKLLGRVVRRLPPS